MIVGELYFEADEARHRLWCDRLAVDRSGALMAASVCGCNTEVASFCALLHERSVKADIEARDIAAKHWRGWDEENLFNLTRNPHGYRIYRLQLARGIFHAFAIAKDQSLIRSVSDDTVWSLLSSDRFTTPMLRTWTPWIVRQLRDEELLVSCTNFNMNAGVLSATDADLDRIVSDGVRAKRLLIA